MAVMLMDNNINNNNNNNNKAIFLSKETNIDSE